MDFSLALATQAPPVTQALFQEGRTAPHMVPAVCSKAILTPDKDPGGSSHTLCKGSELHPMWSLETWLLSSETIAFTL